MSVVFRLILIASACAATPVRVLPCSSWNDDPDVPDRGWSIASARSQATAAPFTIRNAHAGTTLCLDADGDGAIGPVAAPCDDSKPSQQWLAAASAKTADAQLFFTGAQNVLDPRARCLMVSGSTYSVGPGLLLSDCVQTGFRQHAIEWTVANATVRSHAGGCCGDIFGTRPVCLAVDREPRCADLGPRAAWCDSSLGATTRARALVAAMTLTEKASNMDSHNFGVPRLAVPPNIFSEALHGMCSGCGAPTRFPASASAAAYTSTGCPTSFPQVISMGASWNRSLWSAAGRKISDEVRGLYAQGNTIGWSGALFLWTPNVNPFRDPRWGRGQEVPSEDPLVCAEYAAHYIPAMQGSVTTTAPDGQNHTFLKTVVTAKHFFDYDLEGHGDTSRQQIDVNVSARDQAEYFSPPFRAAIERGHAQSVMCSYNAVNGMPACLSDAMINGVLRKDWGFDGFVVSDCDAISDGATSAYIARHFNGTAQHLLQVQAQQALRGGTDLNCGSLYGEQNAGAVRAGLLSEAELDVALERVYTKAFQLGILDAASQAAGHMNPNPYSRLGADAVDAPASRALAMEGALQGQVLLKNENGRLPLAAERVRKLALIGPHANGSTVFLGGKNYHGFNQLVDENTPLLRARAKLPAGAEVVYEQGCDLADPSKANFAAATAAAAGADAVILFLGTDGTIENEGHDRDSIELPGVQGDLALAVADAASVPVVIVLVNGGTLAIPELKDSPKVGAILEAFLPGQYGAEAVLSLLLGESSPSGLLPVTVYDTDFTSRRPITNLALREAGGVTYRYYEGVPLWPFGFGLSYADFNFRGNSAAVLHTTVAEAENAPLCFGVTVGNAATSRFVADIVVLGFVSSAHADAPANPKLCDFSREAAVAPGTTREVKVCANGLQTALALVDASGSQRVLPGNYTITVGVKGGVGGAGAGSVVGTVIIAP